MEYCELGDLEDALKIFNGEFPEGKSLNKLYICF